MHLNVRSPSIRDNPGYGIRDRDWSINGPIIGPVRRQIRWPEPRSPKDERDEWPPEDRRNPRVPDDDLDDLPLPSPHIVPAPPVTCWLI